MYTNRFGLIFFYFILQQLSDKKLWICFSRETMLQEESIMEISLSFHLKFKWTTALNCSDKKTVPKQCVLCIAFKSFKFLLNWIGRLNCFCGKPKNLKACQKLVGSTDTDMIRFCWFNTLSISASLVMKMIPSWKNQSASRYMPRA